MIRTVLLHMISPGSVNTPPEAVFMHCTTGNNRTGAFVALLLLLLGVTGEIVAQEYALSEAGLAPTRHINVERLLEKGAFQEYELEEARRKCMRMVGARQESMEALIVEVEKMWGGAEGYFLREVGLSNEDLEKLRNVLIEEECERVFMDV